MERAHDNYCVIARRGLAGFVFPTLLADSEGLTTEGPVHAYL